MYHLGYQSQVKYFPISSNLNYKDVINVNNDTSQADLLSEWLHDNEVVGQFLCDFLQSPHDHKTAAEACHIASVHSFIQQICHSAIMYWVFFLVLGTQ